MVEWLKRSKLKNVKYDLECWRRLALMVGAAASGYSFKELISMAKRSKDLFKGLKEAVKPCSIDKLFLSDGELNQFSRALLVLVRNDVYKVYADKWMDVAKELEELRNKWISRGRSHLVIERIYAIGLAALLAGARAAGRDVDVKTAETALWLSGFSVAVSLTTDTVIDLLYPLKDLHKSGWIHLINIATQQTKVTNKVLEELNTIYEEIHSLEEWVKAETAVTYARVGDMNKACYLLNDIKDYILKIIAETLIYLPPTKNWEKCSNDDPCEKLNKLSQSLENLEKQASLNPKELLESHPEFRRYLEWNTVAVGNLEKILNIIIKNILGPNQFSLGLCTLMKGEFEEAEKYFRRAADVSHEIDWIYYLNARLWNIHTMVLKGSRLKDIIKEFKELWKEALKRKEPGIPYLIAIASILGDYLIALALAGKHRNVEKLLEIYGQHLERDQLFSIGGKVLFATTHLTLKYLGSKISAPSGLDVLESIKEEVVPEFLPTLIEFSGKSIIDISKECAKYGNSELCINAYMAAVKGNKAAEENIRQITTQALSKIGVPLNLLEKADARQLIEISAPISSSARFILLLWDLISSDRDTALLHAEVMKAVYRQMLLGKLFGELADALKNRDEDKVKSAIVKLYYFHF